MINWNKIKYYLGMRCVVGYKNEGYVITECKLYGRVCLSKDERYWWSICIDDYCVFDKQEDANKALEDYKNKTGRYIIKDKIKIYKP